MLNKNEGILSNLLLLKIKVFKFIFLNSLEKLLNLLSFKFNIFKFSIFPNSLGISDSEVLLIVRVFKDFKFSSSIISFFKFDIGIFEKFLYFFYSYYTK